MVIQINNAFLSLLSFCLFVISLVSSPVIFALPNTIEKTAYFLSVADIHFDPFSSCHPTTPCPLIDQLQQAPATQWGTIFAAHNTEAPQYAEDSNYPLLESTLAELKTVATEKNVGFVLLLGDSLAHNFKKNYLQYASNKSDAAYQAFVKNTMTFLRNEFANTFPSIDVYPVIGNNDSYEENYVSTPNGVFFSDMASLWSELIKDKDNRAILEQDFPKAGYYAVDLPHQTQLRLIILNTVLFSKYAQGVDIEHAANQQMDWLHHELASLSAKHQKAIIALHIPVGIDIFTSFKKQPFTMVELWQADDTQRFLSEVQQFASDIAVILSAHMHADAFQLMNSTNHQDVPVSATPSISPIYGNNPGFKIYQYSLLSSQLIDFVTYYYALDKEKKWRQEYDFNKTYQPFCHLCQMLNGMEVLQKTGALADRYQLFYGLQSDNRKISTQWTPYYWCGIRSSTAADFKHCTQNLGE